MCARLGQYEDDCEAAVDSYLPEIMQLLAVTVVCNQIEQGTEVTHGVSACERKVLHTPHNMHHLVFKSQYLFSE